MKMIFDSHANTTHLHMKGLALSLVLKVRGFWNSEMAWWKKNRRVFSLRRQKYFMERERETNGKFIYIHLF